MASQPTLAPPMATRNVLRFGLSREELAALERELGLYLTFWAHARDESDTPTKRGIR
jgi:hypothetical protein